MIDNQTKYEPEPGDRVICVCDLPPRPTYVLLNIDPRTQPERALLHQVGTGFRRSVPVTELAHHLKK